MIIMKKYILVAVLILIVIVLLLNPFSTYNYKKYTVEGNCKIFHSDCTCIGNLVIEGAPEQFFCNGYEFCSNVNETECI